MKMHVYRTLYRSHTKEHLCPEAEGRTTCFNTVVFWRAGLPQFDVILLGLGPDGHVASLFPNRSQLAATHEWVLPVENSPKPPPERITLSLPVINRCVCLHPFPKMPVWDK